MAALDKTVTIEPFGPAGAIILTDAEVTELGGGKRAAVSVTIGDRSARLRLAVMDGRNCIGISRANRAALAIEIGDTVTARVALDVAERDVEMPPALGAALAGDAEAKAIFDGLAYSHRKEFARWIAEAKRDETRARRVAAAVAMLHAGRTRS